MSVLFLHFILVVHMSIILSSSFPPLLGRSFTCQSFILISGRDVDRNREKGDEWEGYLLLSPLSLTPYLMLSPSRLSFSHTIPPPSSPFPRIVSPV